MTIIFFHGGGSSETMLNYLYNPAKKRYIKNDFMQRLKKIDKVYVPHIPYTDIYHYTDNPNFPKQMNAMYKPIDKLNVNDLTLDKYIRNIFSQLDTKVYPPPYIVMGHSHGAYYAVEFARQFPGMTSRVISLDGSWITREMCKYRLEQWKKKGKVVFQIKNQQILDNIVREIKKGSDNIKYINLIVDYTRYMHTKYIIKNDFVLKNIPVVTFRDFVSKPANDMDREYNKIVLAENSVLDKHKNHQIIILEDATHEIWLHKRYKRRILEYIKKLKIDTAR